MVHYFIAFISGVLIDGNKYLFFLFLVEAFYMFIFFIYITL